MAPPNPKALAAFKAMRALGIPAETIKPNLKKLYNLYDKNWSLIEEDNYRALADFIFESQEEEAKKEEANVEAPLVSPVSATPPLLKRPKIEKLQHLGGGGGGDGFLNGDAVEPDVALIRRNKRAQDEPRGLKHMPNGAEFGSHSGKGGQLEGDKGKWLVSRTFGSREEGISGSKGPSGECDNAQFNVSRSVVYPIESASIRNEERALIEYMLPCNAKGKYEDNGLSDKQRRSVATVKTPNPDPSSSDLEIASSELGDVKISMCLDFASEEPDFRMPNLDEVLKMVEDKCIKNYQITDPGFSLQKLMNDFCETCVEAGTETEKDGEGIVNGVPAIDSLKNSSAHLTANSVLILSADGKVQSTWDSS
ncbi:hypothetical protein C5167_024971 [Papaver somniferum]|uniref:WIYLD domain-containing protein n=1 Tax=Papaver somniferum TaxID=3469 RepID=A0A4Y7JTW2_PAPSO|nr:probable inactive histone-lysine N-methyltransferase SUVR2 isoform X1 [Papaver somniferum]RZC63209.1 hypothetical protein C5167_024971 [Papaver somniferum]